MSTAAGAPSAHELVSAFDHAPIGVAVATPHGVVTACNAAMGELLHRAPRELVGGTFFEHTHPDDLELARANCTLMQEGRTRILRHECRFVRSDGEIVWVQVSTSRVPGSATREPHLIMHIEDVGDRKALEAELSHRALHDPLTGLANRSLLTERIHEALHRAERPGHLFYVDLDGFKAVNDRYGHAAGDRVLTELAHRLHVLVGPDDTAARLGGDEFAVLCPAVDAADAERVAAGLRAAAAEPFPVGDTAVTLSAAVGWTAVVPAEPGRPRLVERLLDEADRSMYAIKAHARQIARNPL